MHTKRSNLEVERGGKKAAPVGSLRVARSDCPSLLRCVSSVMSLSYTTQDIL